MKSPLLSIFLFFILFLPGIDVHGYDVIAIKSADIKPYNLALEGFKSVSKANIIKYVITTGLKDDKNIIEAIRSEPPDLILATGLDALLLVKEEIDDIPVVYCMVMYPEKCGLTNNKNEITGVTLTIPVRDKLLRFKSVIPDLRTLGVMYDPEITGHLMEEGREISRALGINLITAKVRSSKYVPKALRKLIGKIDALWLTADSTVVTKESFEFILLSTLENKIPLLTYEEAFVQVGALLSFSPDYFYAGKQTGRLADDIIKKKVYYLQ